MENQFHIQIEAPQDPTLQEDLERIARDEALPLNEIIGKSFLVTGATGLVGGALVRRLARDGHRVLALARHAPAAPFPEGVRFIAADVRHPPEIAGTVDGIIHAAAPTSGRFFSEHPDETYAIIVEGTRALLDFACAHGTSAFVFLSSMEVYGAPATDAPLDESAGFVGDHAAPRNSYPRGKRAAEALCAGKLETQSFPQTLLRAVLCGVLMYLAVSIYRDLKTPLGILFCIPVFILSGFEHSIADCFYFAASGIVSWRACGFLWTVILGNSLGGVLLPLLGKIGKKEKQA